MTSWPGTSANACVYRFGVGRDRRTAGEVVDAVLIGQVALRGHVVGHAAAHLERVGAAPQRQRVGHVPGVFRDHAPGAGGDAAGDRVAGAVELHAVAFRGAQIVVPRPLSANFVQHAVGDDRRPHVVERVDVVGPDVAGARQLQTAALVVLRPPHHVVADGQRLRRREPEVAADVPLVFVGRRRNDRAWRFRRRDRHLASLAAPLVAAEEERRGRAATGPPTLPPNCCWLNGTFCVRERRDGVEIARPHHQRAPRPA